MVKLVIDDYEQISILEEALITANIKYEIEIKLDQRGICPPYIVVDGVPLDTNRAMKWIGEHKNG